MPVIMDPKVVEAVMRGDQAALSTLLQAYQHPLYNVCLRMLGNRDDAAEITQEALLKIVEHIGDFHGQSDISTWMIRIVMNLSISHLRKRKLRRTVSLDNESNAGGWNGDDQGAALRGRIADAREPGPESSVQQKEMIANLHAALGAMEDDLRGVIVLRDIQEMSYDEVASVLGLPVGTVKSRLFRARLALRQAMLKATTPGGSRGSIGTTGSATVASGSVETRASEMGGDGRKA